MIPAHIILLAQKNAELSRADINIYKTRYDYMMFPQGYAVPDRAILVGYVTKDLVFHESGDGDETTKESSIDSD